MDAGTGNNANIRKLILVAFFAGQNGNLPQVGNIGYLLQTLLAPLIQVILCAVAPQNDQHLAAGQQAPVHRIKNVGVQLVIERRIEQQAFAGGQVVAAAHIVHTGFQSGVHLFAEKRGIVFSNMTAVFLQVNKDVLDCAARNTAIVYSGAVCRKLIAKKRLQRLTQQRIHGNVSGIIGLHCQV